jgi:hypothetical protein
MWPIVIGFIFIAYLVKKSNDMIMNRLEDIEERMAKDPKVEFEEQWRKEDPETFADYEVSKYLDHK